MALVDGRRARQPGRPKRRRSIRRGAEGEDLVDVLADLHAVDIDAVGLGDLARREGYIERQLRRWTTQWEKSKTRELPAIDEVAERLATRVPVQESVVIAHGDYRFGNCLTDRPPSVASTPCSTGSCARSATRSPTSATSACTGPIPATAGRHNDPTGVEGFPTYAELLERYASAPAGTSPTSTTTSRSRRGGWP